MAVGAGAGEREMGRNAQGCVVSFGMMKVFWNWWWWWLHNLVNVLNATALWNVKRFVLYYIHFFSS